MKSGDVRKGASQANFNEKFANIVYVEIFVVAGIVAWYYENWYVFLGTLLGMVSLLFIPYLNIVLAITLSLGWGVLGYFGGQMISQEAGIVIGIIVVLSGLGTHFAAIEWTKDISTRHDRNL